MQISRLLIFIRPCLLIAINHTGFTHVPSRFSIFQARLKGKVKGNVFPYSLSNVGPGDDPRVQAVSPQMTISHQPGGRQPLLLAEPAVTFPWPVPSYTAW